MATELKIEISNEKCKGCNRGAGTLGFEPRKVTCTDLESTSQVSIVLCESCVREIQQLMKHPPAKRTL